MMGPAADNLQEYLFSLLDLCVRELHPHTEEIARESYRSLHCEEKAKHRLCSSPQQYCAVLAQLNFTAVSCTACICMCMCMIPVCHVPSHSLQTGHRCMHNSDETVRLVSNHTLPPSCRCFVILLVPLTSVILVVESPAYRFTGKRCASCL